MDDLSDIRELYDAGWEREEERLDRHQLERDITWRHLEAHLPPQGRVLEIGIGAGHYTFELARRGYQVFGVDLSAGLVERCKARADALGLADAVCLQAGDARQLGVVDQFDAVLLMGPLYHLVVEADRHRALSNAYSNLKAGGIVFSSFLSRFGILGDRISRRPSWIEDTKQVRSILERGHRPADSPRGGFRGYYTRLDEIGPMHEGVGFETVAICGVEPGISADDASYNRLEGKRRQLWLDLLFEVSTEPSMVASSRHLLYIGRRPDEDLVG